MGGGLSEGGAKEREGVDKILQKIEKHVSVMIKYMIFPLKLSVFVQVALKIISIDKTDLLNFSSETIIYMSSKLMINLGNIFRKCL